MQLKVDISLHLWARHCLLAPAARDIKMDSLEYHICVCMLSLGAAFYCSPEH
jgi:hypothetical protein